MLETVAFQSGIFVIIATTIFSLVMWILAVLVGVRVECVGILYSAGFDLYKSKIKSVELILGWIPTGSFVKMAGMMADYLDKETAEKTAADYEFRSKSLGTRCLIIFSSPILLAVIGIWVLINSSTISIGTLIELYINVSLFRLPLEAGEPIWSQLYTNPVFLMGFLFFIMGIGNLFTNLSSIINSDENKLGCLATAMPFSMLIFMLALLRLIWLNISLMNLLYYFAGAIIAGIIGMLLSILLAFVLPNH